MRPQSNGEVAELRAELEELRVRLDSLVALVVYTSPHAAAKELRSDPAFNVTETPTWPRRPDGRPALHLVPDTNGGGDRR